MADFSPPTDNLYKFMAISGLALVIACLLGPWRLLQDLRRGVFELEAEVSVAQVEVTALDDDMNGLKAEVTIIENLVDSLSAAKQIWDSHEAERFTRPLESLKERNNVIREQSREQRVAMARRRAKERELTQLLADADRVAWLSYLGLFAGSGVSFLGFGLWYRRVQMYLDRDLRAGKE